ncbi:MAG: hypothetical protein QOK02_981 [Mycobacterium sp.]|nr:hypothetical protein [Mycobacterium sp.]
MDGIAGTSALSSSTVGVHCDWNHQRDWDHQHRRPPTMIKIAAAHPLLEQAVIDVAHIVRNTESARAAVASDGDPGIPAGAGSRPFGYGASS